MATRAGIVILGDEVLRGETKEANIAHMLPLLEEWGGYFSSQIKTGAQVFVFCHSPENLSAPYLCRELHRLVASDVEIPSLPWAEADADTFEQGKLF